MAAPRRRWPLEIKRAAVAQLEGGRAVNDIAAELGAYAFQIKDWRVSLAVRAARTAGLEEQRRQEQLDKECRARTLAMTRHYDRCRERRAYAF